MSGVPGMAAAMTVHLRGAIVLGALLKGFDLAGTFVFAISGAVAGARHRLDWYGVLVLSFVAATFGGITRDVLIGAVPPAAMQDSRYVAVSIFAGFVVVIWHKQLNKLRNAVQIFDAAGLGLFAVTGAGKALAYHLGPVPAALLGMVTGIGGGVARDVLVAEIPIVFRADIYAFAALVGAGVYVAGALAHLPTAITATTGALLCFAIRMIGIHRGWQLPRFHGLSKTGPN